MTTAHIGAYWGPQAQSVDAAIEKLQRLLAALRESHLVDWRNQAFSKKKALAEPVVIGSPEDLRRRLLAGIQVTGNCTNDTIDGGGTSLSWWNAVGDDAAAAVLMVRLGITNPKAGFNSVTLQLPDSEREPALYAPASGRRLMSAFIEILQPERANWLTRDIERLQKGPNRTLPNGSVAIGTIAGHPAGWATYLRDGYGAGFNRALLPESADVDVIGGGTLVTLAGEPVNPRPGDLLAVRAAMGYDVPESDTTPTQAPPPLSEAGLPGGSGLVGAPATQTGDAGRPTAAPEQAQPMPAAKPPSG